MKMDYEGSKRCIILGGGGHARVLIDALSFREDVSIVGILDVSPDRWGTDIMGVLVLGADDKLEALSGTLDCFVVGLGTVGNTHPRRRLYELGIRSGLDPLQVIHPSVICSKWAVLGRGIQLLPGCIINAGAEIGENVIVNSGAIVEHDCIIGDHAHIATGAKLASTVRVGAGAHIGAGATVRQCIIIGNDAVVGAGAVVVKDVPPNITVVGVPAHPL